MEDDRDKVRSRINIVDVIARKVNLKRTGRGYTGLCPFHDDKNPSFTVNPATGTYRCWSCGARGDVFTFVMESERLGFREALEQLAAEAGVALSKRSNDPDTALRQRREAAMLAAQEFFVAQWAASKVARQYCEGRNLPPEIVAEWGLGYGPEQGEALAIHLKKTGHSLAECQELFLVDRDAGGGFYDRFRSRLMFPIHDDRGRLVAFGGRIIGSGIPKYINSSDTPLFLKRKVLYGMHKARQAMADKARAVLVEGYLDVIACHRAGVNEAVASLGTSLSVEHATLLKRWANEVVILYDADAAGQKAADRAEEILTEAGLKVRIALMPEGQDPDTLLRDAGPEAVRKAVDGGLSPTEFRLAQLQAKVKPDQDEFWQEAFQILAQSTSALEVERYAAELAGLYPGIRDPSAAIRVIKKEAASRRKHSGEPNKRPVSSQIPRARCHPFEGTVFRGLLDRAHFASAYRALQEDLMFTAEAIEAAAATVDLLGADPEPMEGHQWVPGLPQNIQDLFLSLDARALMPIKLDELDHAILRLRNKKDRRSLINRNPGSSLDDNDLVDLTERLKRLKNRENL